MIRNNRLSYASIGVPWHSFDISRTSLSSLVTSVLVTLISYQAASILFNISFGTRKRHETKLKNIATLLLARYLSSPLAILNSVFRVDWLTRIYYRGEISRGTHIARGPGRVKVKTAAVLLLLVLTGPIIDVVLVTLTLSRTSELTFEEAGFGGVVFGVQDDSGPVETIPFISFCDRAQYEERQRDLVKTFFYLCTSPNLPQAESEDVTGIEIALVNEQMISMRAIVQGSELFSVKWAQLSSDDGERSIKADITESSVLPLVETALDGFEAPCGGINLIGPVPQKVTTEFNDENRLLSSVRVSCEGVLTDLDKMMYATKIIESMKARLTFVESETTLVRNVSDVNGSFTTDRNAVLLERTERNSSLFVLIMVAVALLLVQIVLRLILANDVEEGLESSVRDRLGLDRDIFGVWNDESRVHFRKKYQTGEWCHIGMEREESDEVENLRGGRIGEWNEQR